MMRKVSCNSYLCGIARFIAILTILIAIAALAPIMGTLQASGHAAFRDKDFQSRERAGRRMQTSTSLFLAPIVYQFPGRWDNGAASVAVADVNGDGRPDLIAGNKGNISTGIDVRLGNGDGTFQAAKSYAAGGGPGALAVSDVNGDGKPDVMVAYRCPGNCSSSVGVLLGNGDGTFQPVVTYDTAGGSNTWSLDVEAADVNGDGKPDLVVANGRNGFGTEEGVVGVLLGNGDGTFQAVVTYDSGAVDALAVAVADVNGDGTPDLVLGNWGSVGIGSAISVLLGNGDGTFQTAMVQIESGGFKPDSIVIADVNGDGKPDVIVSNLFDGTDGGWHGSVVVFLGNGDGTFRQVGVYDSGGYDATSVAVADVNGDGKPDVLVGNLCVVSWKCAKGVVGVFLGNGDGTFQKVITFSAAASSIAVADVNGDGRPDLMVAHGTVSVLWNATAPNLATTVVETSGSPSIRGQSVTFTATVKSTPGIPDGETMTFHDGLDVIGTATTANGVAKFTTSTLRLGKHLIEAVYPGDAAFTPGLGTMKQVVELYSTTTALTSTPNPSSRGRAVSFTATVTSAGPNAPTGKVVFMDGTTRIGSAMVANGMATLIKSTLAVGTHPITAHYLGDTADGTSTSQVVEQVVQ